MYLVFVDTDFFGNTHSKKVVKSMKDAYQNVHSLHVNEYNTLSFEYSYMTSDEYQIKIFELKDKTGSMRSIVSTEYEQDEAISWINNIIIAGLSIENMGSELFNSIPIFIRRHLSEYQPVDPYIICDTIDQFGADIYELTYEGYLMYLKRGDLSELEKDICMLSEK